MENSSVPDSVEHVDQSACEHVEMTEEERHRAFFKFVSLLITADKRLRMKKEQVPQFAPPDEFWMDPE